MFGKKQTGMKILKQKSLLIVFILSILRKLVLFVEDENLIQKSFRKMLPLYLKYEKLFCIFYH